MLVISTRAAKYRHVPVPWVIGHCVLGFFILKGRQINLYPEASSCLPWSAALLRNPCLVWMLWTLFTLSIQTVSSQRESASWRFLRNLWCSLPPMPPLASAPLLWVNALLIGSVFCIIISFRLPIRGSIQALHPLFNIIGHSWSLVGPWLSLHLPWPSSLHFLLYHSLDDGAATFLHSFHQSLYLCGSPDPIEWASQAKLNVSCPTIGMQLVPGVPTEEQDSLPSRQDHSFNYPVFWPDLL